MLRDIEREVELTHGLTGRARISDRVLDALRCVPRHAFVDEGMRRHAYDDGPLPIGHGQTISQPFIVGLMTDLLDPEPGDRVLEVGTGSGYQAAVLSRVVSRVYSLEIIEALAVRASERLAALGYHNVETQVGDGYHGWVEHSPYDGILVTAAARAVPPALVEQLKPGARLVIPVGEPYLPQRLLLLQKEEGGLVSETEVLPVAFVPLTGGH